jgi:hypothetical protein
MSACDARWQLQSPKLDQGKQLQMKDADDKNYI